MTTGQPDVPAPAPEKPDQQAAGGGDSADAVLARLRADCNWKPDPLGKASTAPHARTWFQQREEQLKKDLPTGQDYTVQAGDSMGDIAYRAVRHDMKPEDFAKLSKKDLIKAEQEMQKRIVEAKANQKYFPCGDRPDLVRAGLTLTIPPAEAAQAAPATPSDATPKATTPAAPSDTTSHPTAPTATHDAGEAVKTPQQLSDEWSTAFKFTNRITANGREIVQSAESFNFDPEAYATAMKGLKAAAVQAYNQGGEKALKELSDRVADPTSMANPVISRDLQDDGSFVYRIHNQLLISRGDYDKIKDPFDRAQYHLTGAYDDYYYQDLTPPVPIDRISPPVAASHDAAPPATPAPKLNPPT